MGWGSVRIRLTLWNAVIVAALMITCGLVLGLNLQSELGRSIDAGLAAAVWPLRTAPPYFPPPIPGPGVFGMVAGGPGQPTRGGMFGTSVLANDGLTPLPRFFAVTEGLLPTGEPGGMAAAWDPDGCAAAAAGHERYATVTRAGTRMRVLSAPMRRRGEVVAVVQVAHSLDDQDHLTRVEASIFSIFVPFSVLVAALAAALLTGRALRPVRYLAQAADEIGASDLSCRLEVQGNDEFADLSRTFNRMIVRLSGAFQALEQGYQRVADAHARLQSAYERERRFTSDASLELGTPLAQLKACTSLALSAERTATSYRESLEMVDRCSDTMTQIVCDLLLLARGDAAQLGLRIEVFAGADVVREAVSRVERGSGARIRVRAPADVEVRADREHLTRVLVNLLENAVHHTPANGSVWVDVGGEGREVILTVEDTGEGIPPEHLPHVGERFYRVDGGRDRIRGGTGLGLAICRSIVQAHGGALEIESEVGRGTRVRVRLPQTPALPAHGAPGDW